MFISRVDYFQIKIISWDDLLLSSAVSIEKLLDEEIGTKVKNRERERS